MHSKYPLRLSTVEKSNRGIVISYLIKVTLFTQHFPPPKLVSLIGYRDRSRTTWLRSLLLSPAAAAEPPSSTQSVDKPFPETGAART